MQLNLFCAVSVQTFFSKIGTSLLLYVVSSLLRQLLASQLVVLTHHLHLPDGFLSDLFRNFLWTDFTHFGRFWSTNISLKSRIRMLAISGSGPHPSSTHVWTVSKLSWSCWSCWSRQAFESTKSNPRNFLSCWTSRAPEIVSWPLGVATAFAPAFRSDTELGIDVCPVSLSWGQDVFPISEIKREGEKPKKSTWQKRCDVSLLAF